MTDCKKISRNIRFWYGAMLSIVVALAVVAELDLVPIEGELLLDAGAKYFVEVAMFFLAGICILLSLKGFDWLWKRKSYKVKEESRTRLYMSLYVVRLAILVLPMLLGTFFYYGLLDNRGLYCALASFVASLFCLPSAEGVGVELNVED